MYLVRADDIQLTIGRKILLSHVSFTIQPQEKIGLVGKNGTGKSTLLKTLSKRAPPRKGEIDVRTTTYYVPQEVQIPKEQQELTVISYVMSQYEEGWNIFHTIEKLFDYDKVTADKTMGQLSGGELMMLHLALAFLIQPDLLLLDEPTNHLDQVGTERLIKELRHYPKALVVISHDSYLLEQVVSRIYEIRDQKLNKFSGSYNSFIEQKKHEREVLQRKLRVHTKEVTSALKRKQQISERTMRSEAAEEKYKAKGVPSIMRGFFLDRAGKSTSHDMALARAAEREERAEIKDIKSKLKKTQTLNIELGSYDESVFSLVDFSKATLFVGETKLLENLTLRVTNQDKVLLAGRNGVGKSSLLKAIQKEAGYSLTADSKPILPQSSIYIDQHYSLLQSDQTLVSHIAQRAAHLDYEEIRKVLGNYLFIEEEQVNRTAGTLSGGEKARLALAMASVTPRTLLLLDEPTNNLDTESVDELLEALNGYAGGILLVSHDIGFISKLALTQKMTL